MKWLDMNTEMKIHNYDKMGSTDKLSFHKAWKAYMDNTNGNEEIFEMGFNPNTGYAYIALKFEEIHNFEHTPHPIEFEMYYSC